MAQDRVLKLLQLAAGLNPGLVGQRPASVRLGPLDPGLHPKLSVGLKRAGEELVSSRPVAGPIARQQHARIVMLGVGNPGATRHVRIDLERVAEVTLGLFPSLGCRGRDPEVPRHAPDRDLAGRDRVQSRIRKEEPVQRGRAVAVAEQRGDLSEYGKAEEPLRIAWEVGELVGSQVIEAGAGSILAAEFAVEQGDQAVEAAIAGVVVDAATDELLDLLRPPRSRRNPN